MACAENVYKETKKTKKKKTSLYASMRFCSSGVRFSLPTFRNLAISSDDQMHGIDCMAFTPKWLETGYIYIYVYQGYQLGQGQGLAPNQNNIDLSSGMHTVTQVRIKTEASYCNYRCTRLLNRTFSLLCLDQVSLCFKRCSSASSKGIPSFRFL